MTKKSTLQLFGLLFFCLAATTNLHAQLGTNKWSFSNPKPFGFVSYQISYASDNVALVVGEAGGIAKTNDGGATWTYFAYTTTNAGGTLSKPVFNDVQFVNASLAYAVGTDGIMVKSLDGGVNWSLVNTPFYNDQLEINSVYFINATTGYIAGSGDPVTRQATLYKTTNGGATWTADHVFPQPAEEWLEPALFKIRFSSTGTGYVGGANGLIFKFQNGVWSDYSISATTIFTNVNATDTVLYDNFNGGFDTVVTTYEDNVFGLDQQNYRALAIVNDTAVIVGTQNNGGLIRINTSTTGGSYQIINSGSAYAQIYAPFGSPQIYNLVSKGQKIAGASSNGTLLISQNGGLNWENQQVYPEDASEAGIAFYGVDISAAGRVGMCGQAGIIADSLTAWRRPYKYVKKSLGFSGYGIEDIAFADASHGIAAGSGGTMLRTADGGTNWEDISNNSFSSWDYWTSMSYPSQDILLAAASNGMFYKSFDRGSSFDLFFTEEHNANLTSIHFNGEDTGWMIANITYTDEETFENSFHQIIYRTVDGGITWDSSNTVFPTVSDYSLNNYLYSIKFFGASIGYAAGMNGAIFKTIDGGVNWVRQMNVPVFATDKTINSLAVVDANVAYASGGQALVMKTVDGGANWTMCNTGLPTEFANYPKILMYDATQGLVFSSGSVYSTKDGGASWTANHAPFGDNFASAAFAPIDGCTEGICKKVYAAGMFRGNILKLDADVVLPVKFSNLTGSGVTTGNQLFWTAFAQETVRYFDIQRSTDGVRFETIGDKVYSGRLNYESYQWLDRTAVASRNYYRIRATEATGAVYYTNVVLISNRKSGAWTYQLMTDNLIIRNAAVLKGNVTVQVMTNIGQVVASKSWNQNGGAFNDMISLPPGANGVYVVKITNEGTQYAFKISVQRF